MTPLTWPCPLPGGGIADEYALTFDRRRAYRLLVVPALFDEANRMRRLTVEVMRRLDACGIDCFLVDFPGLNESLQSLAVQSTEDWRDAMSSAARHFRATHVLATRGGCLFAPAELPAWHYAPVKGESILRQLVRARIVASREAGRDETREELMDAARTEGIELGGYELGPEFVEQFERMVPVEGPQVRALDNDTVGGSGLWLRAEPGENTAQADALAAILAIGVRS